MNPVCSLLGGWSAGAHGGRAAALSRAAGWTAVSLLPFLPAPAAGAAAPPPMVEMVSHVGISRVAFTRLNENDAKAAYKVLNAELARKLGYDLSVEISQFDTPAEFARAIRAQRISYIIAGTWEFLNMAVEDSVDIEFSAVNGDTFAHRWLLLVRRDSGITTVGELKGKAVTLLYNNMATLGRPWLETELLEQGLGTPERFFGSCEAVTKPTGAVLPVFFGKAQACIVDEATLNLMVELNPQLRTVLVPVAQSEPLLDGIICFSRDGWPSPQARADMRRSIAHLEQEASGRQLLTLFKCSRLVTFEPAHLASVRRLFARHHQLLAAAPP